MADHSTPQPETKGHLIKTVVLVGMMGCGKTAVGSELSRQLQVPFLDSDAEIEKAANAPVAEIFARHGETFFRAKETLVLERLLHGPVCVLSTGGGAFASHQNRALIREHAVSVWLNAPLDVLWTRVRHKTTRPLLMTKDPKKSLADLLKSRQSTYALADISVVGDDKVAISDMALRVQKALQAQGSLV